MKPQDNEHPDPAFEAFLRELPAQQPIPDEVAIRLAHARASALATSQSHTRWTRFLPQVAASFVVLLGAGVLLFNVVTEPAPDIRPSLIAEMESLPDQADLELIDELDFYLWYSEVEAG